MNPTDEAFFVQLAVAGDAAALATLLQAYDAELCAYAARRLPQKVRPIVAPEDIVQETHYEACRSIQNFVSQGPGSFYRWLVRIAKLRMLGAIQKHRARRTQALSGMGEYGSVLGVLEQLVQYRRTPSASAAAHEFVSHVERSLEQLNADYRQVIVHRFIEGLSVSETATRMARSADSIYVLSSRALAALRQQLESASNYL
jgi:RNA polymerase sigma-70 factor (ECF subfamily)